MSCFVTEWLLLIKKCLLLKEQSLHGPRHQEKITVAIDHEVPECSGPLVPPLFQL
jgi:hypothetical protein